MWYCYRMSADNPLASLENLMGGPVYENNKPKNSLINIIKGDNPEQGGGEQSFDTEKLKQTIEALRAHIKVVEDWRSSLQNLLEKNLFRSGISSSLQDQIRPLLGQLKTSSGYILNKFISTLDAMSEELDKNPRFNSERVGIHVNQFLSFARDESGKYKAAVKNLLGSMQINAQINEDVSSIVRQHELNVQMSPNLDKFDDTAKNAKAFLTAWNAIRDNGAALDFMNRLTSSQPTT